jgi:hypothetical protein
MAHELFNIIPNASMAEACSEILEPNCFKFFYDPRLDSQHDEGGFPPAPSYFTSILATYIEKGTPPRQPSQFFTWGRTDNARIAREYQKLVSPLQSAASRLKKYVAKCSQTDLRAWHIDTVKKSGKRLLGAHITAQTVEGNRLISAIATPRVVYDNLPNLFQDSTTLLELYSELEGSSLPGEKIDALRKDPSLRDIGAASVASLLPDAHKFISSINRV